MFSYTLSTFPSLPPTCHRRGKLIVINRLAGEYVLECVGLPVPVLFFHFFPLVINEKYVRTFAAYLLGLLFQQSGEKLSRRVYSNDSSSRNSLFKAKPNCQFFPSLDLCVDSFDTHTDTKAQTLNRPKARNAQVEQATTVCLCLSLRFRCPSLFYPPPSLLAGRLVD